MLKSSFIFSVTEIISRVLNLATNYIILQFCDKSIYGEFQYYLATANVILTIANFGVDPLIFRQICSNDSSSFEWMKKGLNIKFILNSISIILILVYCFYLNHYFLLSCYILVFSENLIQLFSMWYKSKKLALYNLVLSIGRGSLVFLLVLYFIVTDPSVYSIQKGYIAGCAIVLLSFILNLFKIYKSHDLKSVRYKSFLRAAPAFGFIALLGSIYIQMPIFYLGSRADYLNVGLFAVYLKFLSPFCLFGTNHAQSFQIHFTQLNGNLDRFLFFKKSLSMQVIIGLVMFFLSIIFGDFILRHFGNIIKSDINILFSFSLLPITMGLSSFVDAVLVSCKKESTVLFSYILITLIFWLVLSFLIKSNLVLISCVFVALLLIRSLCILLYLNHFFNSIKH